MLSAKIRKIRQDGKFCARFPRVGAPEGPEKGALPLPGVLPRPRKAGAVSCD